ncbi:MAG: hypothetical protein MUP81_05770, partial [Dehalococcoidia bacterium]|nr:hypothetical protein [Dehalococcoidia bacterium]
MKQVIVGGYSDALFGAATEYNYLMGGYNWSGTEYYRYQCIPTGGTIDSLFIELSANIAADSTGIFTLMVAGAPSTLTCTIGAGAAIGSDVAHSVAVTAGQTVSIRATYTGTPGTPSARWTTRFTGTTAGESICLANTQASAVTSIYTPIQGKTFNLYTTEANVQQPIPTPGTFKKLYVVLNEDPGTDPDAYTIALRVGGATKNNTVTIVANNTTGNITNVTDAVVAGNLVDFIVIPVSGPSVSSLVAIGIVFIADTDGESLIMGGSTADAPSTSATEYMNLCGASETTWNATETTVYSLIQTCTIKNLYVNLSAAPGAGDPVKSYTISINKDAGAASGLTVTISTAATTGNDTAHTYDPANGDTADIKCVPANTPAATYANIGLVCYIAAGVIHEGAATLSGVGTLVGIGQGIFIGKGTLSGVGTLAGIGRGIFIGKGVLSGTGTVVSIGSLIAIGKAVFSGVGTLVGAGRLTAIGKAALSGVGTLVANGVGIFIGKSTLAGSGTLAGIGRLIAIGKVVLSGVGTLTGIGSFWYYGAVTLTGAGSLIANGVITAIGKATLSGTGTLTAIGRRIFYGITTLAGTGTLVAIGRLGAIGKATLSGVGTLTALGQRLAYGAIYLTGHGNLAVKGFITAIGKVTFSGIGTLAG